jgi:hypothetical protein
LCPVFKLYYVSAILTIGLTEFSLLLKLVLAIPVKKCQRNSRFAREFQAVRYTSDFTDVIVSIATTRGGMKEMPLFFQKSNCNNSKIYMDNSYIF